MPYDDESYQIARVILGQDELEEVDQIRTLPQPLLHNEGDVLSSLSPCQRIPLEIWEEIFVQCLPDDEYVAIRAHNAPMLLAGVCRLWRSIVLLTPRLWNSICFNILHFRESAHFHLLSTLGRSGKLPLSIEIWQERSPSYQIERDIVISILPFLSRIRSLKVDGLPWDHVERLLGGQDISALTDLEICIPDNPYCNLDHERRLNLSNCAPCLRKVTLGNFPHGSIMNLLSFPWAKLTEFSAHRMDFKHCFNIFRVCRNLTHLSLTAISTGHDPYDRRIRPHVLLPNLVSLTLGVYQDNDITRLWDNLTLPKLCEGIFGFARGNGSQWTWWSMPQLFALLDRSSCSLRTLEIPDFTCDTNVIECVQRIPTLRNIYFGPSLKGKVLPDQVSLILAQRAASDMNSGESEPLEV
jgi:F-box-like